MTTRSTLINSSTGDLVIQVVNHVQEYVGDSLFITGSLTNWADKHQRVGQVPAVGDSLTIRLQEVPLGHLQLYLTRGDWDTAAVSPSGHIAPLFEGQFDDGMAMDMHIRGWRDLFPASSASPQVHLLDANFFFPELDCYRRVWIYLPKDYADGDQRFPVIYMPDGQQLFDQCTAQGRSGPIEWQVDETIDRADAACIVVGIDHAEPGTARQAEYSFHAEPDRPALGGHYLQDVLFSLKPFIDAHYRTLSGPKHTAMVGSSLGGLISWYAGLCYPELIGHLGVFSPSLWLQTESLLAEVHRALAEPENLTQSHWYFYMGGEERRLDAEGNHWHMWTAFRSFQKQLEDRFPGDLQVVVEQQARHGTYYWQAAFRKFYHYLQQTSFFN